MKLWLSMEADRRLVVVVFPAVLAAGFVPGCGDEAPRGRQTRSLGPVGLRETEPVEEVTWADDESR